MDKKRILLIDDEEMFTRILKAYLEKTGRYDVRAGQLFIAKPVSARELIDCIEEHVGRTQQRLSSVTSFSVTSRGEPMGSPLGPPPWRSTA